MKSKVSKMTKRVLAMLLCMTMMLNGSIATLAEEAAEASEPAVVEEVVEEETTENTAEDTNDEEAEEPVAEEEAPAEEPTAEPEAPSEEVTVCGTCGADPCTCEATEEVTACETCNADPCTCEAAEETTVCETCNADPCACEAAEETTVCETCNADPCTCEAAEETAVCETCNADPCTCEAAEETAVCETCNADPCTCEAAGEVAEAEQITLTAEVDGTVITLSGPASSFEAGKQYSMQVTKIEADGLIEAVSDAQTSGTVEEAVNADEIAEAAAVNEAAEEAAVETVEETKTEEVAEIPASDIDAEKVTEVIEEAIEEAVDAEETTVEKYQAFDIKLYADGEEVQPLGPVEVKFSSKEVAESVEDEDVEVSVFHVDEETGKAQDMGATIADGDVAIETDHFSIYVVVDTSLRAPYITVDIEHYGTITTIAPWTVNGKASAEYKSGASASTDPYKIYTANTGANDWYYTKDDVYDKENVKIATVDYTGQLYTADENVKIPNLYETSIEELSKVCLNKANEQVKNKNYAIEKIVITENNGEKVTIFPYDRYDEDGNENMVEMTYDGKTISMSYSDYIYIYNGEKNKNEQIKVTLNKDVTAIRFYYTEKETSKVWKNPAIFYDYNLTTDGGWYNDENGAGTNTPSNYTGGSSKAKMAMGQWVSGNMATWNWNGRRDTTDDTYYDGYDNDVAKLTYLDYVGFLNICGGYGRTSGSSGSEVYRQSLSYLEKYGNCWNYFNTGYEVKQGLTSNTIEKVNGSYQLTYNSGIQQPGFFEEGKVGTLVLDDYQLGFKQTGDTYILSSVYNGKGTKVNKNTNVGGNSDYSDIKNISIDGADGEGLDVTFSNNFWPLDSLTQEDYTNAGVNFKMDERPSADQVKSKTGSERYSDDHTQEKHNWHFGMRYEFTFKIGDYTGPMNFYFRGDDDFWLYIDGEKAIDIGGIHSAVGQALDVKQWLREKGMYDENRTYTVSIFYMERGGYGSCCYMQYTLPNVTQAEIPTVGTTTQTAKKVWLADEDKMSEVTVQLHRKSAGTDEVIAEAILNEANNWEYKWTYLQKANPNNTSEVYEYYITEKEPIDILETINASGKAVTASISSADKNELETLLKDAEELEARAKKADQKKDVEKAKELREEAQKINASAQISVTLYRKTLDKDGYVIADEEVAGSTKTLNSTNKWSYTWSNLATQKLDEDDKIVETYEYYIYERYLQDIIHTSYSGNTIYNTQKTEVYVKKAWEDPDYQTKDYDGDNFEELRPDIQVKLLADEKAAKDIDGNETATLTLNEANDWKDGWKNIPKYALDGKRINYTVEEVVPSGYEVTYGEFIEDVSGNGTIEVKNEMLYGDLKITKGLDTYNESLGEVSFVFQVEATKKDPAGKDVSVYSNVVSITFDGPGSKYVLIEKIPAGSTVTVTEIVSGGSYVVKEGTADTYDDVLIKANEVVEVEFTNTFDDELNGGNGIVNSFVYAGEDENGDHKWTHSATKDSTEESKDSQNSTQEFIIPSTLSDDEDDSDEETV